MKRVVILGCGASGKSTLARHMGEITGLPVVELDKVFWQAGLAAMPRDEWVAAQACLSRRTDGSWMATWDNLTLLRLASARRTQSSSWTSHFGAALIAQFDDPRALDFWWWVFA